MLTRFTSTRIAGVCFSCALNEPYNPAHTTAAASGNALNVRGDIFI
jgi:hypothetical protein